MKKILTGIGIGILGLFIASIAYASVFNSNQVGSSPVLGSVLQTNGSISTWVATSTLGFAGGSGVTTLASTTAGNLFYGNISGSTLTQNFPINLVNNVSTGTTGTDFNISTSSTQSTNSLIINIPTAANGVRGLLNSTDWNTFNNKQAALSGGAPGQVAYWTSASALGNGFLSDNGTVAGAGATSTNVAFTIQGIAGNNNILNVNTSTSARLMVITPNGSVGLGTTTPIATLSIQGTSTLPTLDLFDISSSGTTSIFHITNTGRVGIATSSPVLGALLTLGSGLSTASSSGINFSGDASTDLYRSATGVLKTDSTFQVNTVQSASTMTLEGSVTSGSAFSIRLQNSGSTVVQSVGRFDQILEQYTFKPASGSSTIASFHINETIAQNANINQTASTTSLLLDPVLTQAMDYRAIDVLPYVWNLATTTALSNAYGTLLNGYTINATSSAVTVSNACQLCINGEPNANGNSSVTITSSTALSILPSTVTSTTTNAYGLFVISPTKATTNLAAVLFGNVALGTTTPAFTTATTSSLSVVGQYFSNEFDMGTTSGASLVFDFSRGNVAHLVLNGNSTSTVANTKPGGRYLIELHQDGTGSRMMGWPANFSWSGGTAPTLTTTAGKVDIITLVCNLYSTCFAGSNLNYAP